MVSCGHARGPRAGLTHALPQSLLKTQGTSALSSKCQGLVHLVVRGLITRVRVRGLGFTRACIYAMRPGVHVCLVHVSGGGVSLSDTPASWLRRHETGGVLKPGLRESTVRLGGSWLVISTSTSVWESHMPPPEALIEGGPKLRLRRICPVRYIPSNRLRAPTCMSTIYRPSAASLSCNILPGHRF